MISLLVLLITILPYAGSAAAFLLAWLYAGWHFSLTAAPAAYELQERFNNGPYKKSVENEKTRAWEHANSVWSTEQMKKKYFQQYFSPKKFISPQESAAKTGQKCLVAGPFAYFLTPQFKNKIEIAWTPAEVTANKLVLTTGETLKKAHELGESTRSALDLGTHDEEVKQLRNSVTPKMYSTKDREAKKLDDADLKEAYVYLEIMNHPWDV